MVDLHTHSYCSDGVDSPERLVDKALEEGLHAFALTDHDSVAGLAAAGLAARGRPILFIPGVEIEIEYDHGEFHLLGLNFNPDDVALIKRLETQRIRRDERNVEILNLMHGAGIELEYEEVKAFAGGDIISRPHFARALVARGRVKDVRQAFDKYLGQGRPFFVEKRGVDLEEATRLIRAAGGYSVIAHPLSLYYSWGKLPAALKKIREAGVDGLEAYHSQCTSREAERLAALAADYGFIVTGGSDYHGDKRPDRKLGRMCEGYRLGDEILDPILRENQKEFWESLKTLPENAST